MSAKRVRLALAASCLAAAAIAPAATFTVTNTNDSGAGSLRQAITDANTSVGADTIDFAIPGSGVQTIAPATALPPFTSPVTIEGFSQAGSSANTNGPGLPDNSVHLIEIDGTNTGFGLGTGVIAFTAGSGGSTVRGLVVNRGKNAGIAILGVADVHVEGCFVGLDPTGLVPHGNGQYGVLVDGNATSAVIGGTTPAARNIISGNATHGIGLGSDLGAGGTTHLIQGNFIGPDATGAAAIANFQTGVAFSYAVTNSTLGGTTAAARNVISGNGARGVLVSNSIGAANITGNQITGNFIGTDLTGTHPLGNLFSAITLSAHSNLIGGGAAGAGNVLAASTNGFGIDTDQADGSTIQGNFVGTDPTGTIHLGNYLGGLSLNDGGLLVGGTAAGEGNVIAFNGHGSLPGGVRVVGGTGFQIRGNSIHDNAATGIDLGLDGVNANDAGDADTGANNHQNFPLIATVSNGATTEVTGFLHSTPSTSFQLDFFANSCARFPRDFLQGETYIGSVSVNTDGSGDTAYDAVVGPSSPGDRITITATDPSGNTSELSQRLPFTINIPSGPAGGGTSFTVGGTDFVDGAVVTLGGVPATGVNVASSTSLSATSPALTAGTANDLVITNPDGTTGTLLKAFVADFLDVPNGQQFYSYVTTLVSNGITAGVGGGLYGVDQSTLRQQMAVFLLKAKHGLCYAPPQCVGAFSDVPCPSTFANWIEALAAEGITGGCGPGIYCPQNPVRRDQMAVFLLKAEHGSSYTPPQCQGTFGDVACPSTFADWIEQLAVENVTGGCGNGNYCPLNPNTRGQMAVFITRTFQLQ
jgi:hypothetical protein